MDKPRIFLGSSGKQEKLLQALTRGLEDVAHVDPWTTSFNPGTTTLVRLFELAHEVDFAAFVFARERSPRVHLRTLRRSGDPCRDKSQQLEAWKAIESEGRVARIEGLWWQFALTARTHEPSAVSLIRISRDRDGALELRGRAWQEDGSLSARYWSEAVKERKEPPGVFFYWKGERPRDPNAP